LCRSASTCSKIICCSSSELVGGGSELVGGGSRHFGVPTMRLISAPCLLPFGLGCRLQEHVAVDHLDLQVVALRDLKLLRIRPAG
jgi:hypothetical protein